MHRLVSLAVAVAIVGHLWFGCCTHHVHLAGECDANHHAAAGQAQRNDAHHRHGHHHHHHADAGQHAHHSHPLVPGGPPVPHHHCQENDCTMLLAGKVPVPEESSPVGSVFESSTSSATSITAEHSFAEPLFAPHVRCHLAHRVLRV